MDGTNLECGGKRSATPLWGEAMVKRTRHAFRKRRRRCALPAQSKKITVIQGSYAFIKGGFL